MTESHEAALRRELEQMRSELEGSEEGRLQAEVELAALREKVDALADACESADGGAFCQVHDRYMGSGGLCDVGQITVARDAYREARDA